jgi:hypothetical protein
MVVRLFGGPALLSIGVEERVQVQRGDSHTDGRRSGYEAPRLVELGPFAQATQADGRHVGKTVGGSDAFLMVGRGAITNTSA